MSLTIETLEKLERYGTGTATAACTEADNVLSLSEMKMILRSTRREANVARIFSVDKQDNKG